MKKSHLASLIRLLDYAEFSEVIRKYGVAVAIIIYVFAISGLFTSNFTSVRELGALAARMSLLLVQVVISWIYINTTSRLSQPAPRAKKTLKKTTWHTLAPILLVAASLAIYVILVFT